MNATPFGSSSAAARMRRASSTVFPDRALGRMRSDVALSHSVSQVSSRGERPAGSADWPVR